ncbi:MAG: hypothetical protein R3B96_20210 [Pirellulaceae bacterium]
MRAIETQRSASGGVEGARALEVAERVLAEINEHAWYGKSLPVRGPLSIPLPRVVGVDEPGSSEVSLVPGRETQEERQRRAG